MCVETVFLTDKNTVSTHTFLTSTFLSVSPCLRGLTAYERSKMKLLEKELTSEIIGAAIEVHKYWGPGLLESIYENSLVVELQKRNLTLAQQVCLPLEYKGTKVGDDLRLDLIIGNKVVVEVKVVTEIAPIHEAQLMTYMRLTQCRVGLLLNFNVPVMREGIKRIVL